MRTTSRHRLPTGFMLIAMILALGLAASEALAQQGKHQNAMSAMGRLATKTGDAIATSAGASGLRAAALAAGARSIDNDDLCQNEPTCPGGFREGPDSTQSELSIAIDSTGKNVVVGFNDFRGFAAVPVSVSGFMYSTDGGKTFTDGGQLPVTTGTDTIGTTLLPQIFGDPEVKYLGGCTFIYSSIVLKKFSATGTAQTMGVHRSTDCGKTWTGPYEVQAATNPNGAVTAGGSAVDAADKEFMDVDPETGRVIMTWSNFTPTRIEMRSAISDDGGFTWPVATGAIISATPDDGQASIPRFARGSNNVYVAWRRFPFPGTTGGYGNTTAFARSTDNGLTWELPKEIAPEFVTQDQILGNDRSNTSPAMAVDRSSGPRQGTIYIVYPNNDSLDGSDIIFQKSTDGGTTFSAPLAINSRPGNDRAQWFPWITVDETTGRVSVFYYDQGIATTGHLSEISYLFSNDGGSTWDHPRPLTLQPFKAGHGNDTSQPNLGDYNQAIARGGRVWFAYAVPDRPPLGFADGQPGTSMTEPDAVVRVLSPLDHAIRHAPVSLQNVSFTAPGGFADPGETISLQLPLFNYATNSLYARDVRFPVVLVRSKTPGVVITDPLAVYSSIAPGQTRVNSDPFTLRLQNKFVPGTMIELEINVISISGLTELRHTIFTGTPVETTLLAEDFETTVPGSLPAGWQPVHAGGANTVPWTTSDTFCGGASNGAFHINANDGPTNLHTRFERLFSPAFNVPADSEYVVVEFDVCYDTEDDPVLPTTGYDGFLLRVTDLTTGRVLRSVLVEAFEDEFTTGDIFHYPRHFPRSSNTAYFQDMSAWSGISNGLQRVRMRLPGMAGSTAQLRFEFTQDGIFTCQDARPGSTECGVFVDNLVVKSVMSAQADD